MDPLYILLKKAANAVNKDKFFDDNELRSILKDNSLTKTRIFNHKKGIIMGISSFIVAGIIGFTFSFTNIGGDIVKRTDEFIKRNGDSSKIKSELSKGNSELSKGNSDLSKGNSDLSKGNDFISSANDNHNSINKNPIILNNEIIQNNRNSDNREKIMDINLGDISASASKMDITREDGTESYSDIAYNKDKKEITGTKTDYNPEDIIIGKVRLKREELEKVRDEILDSYADTSDVKYILWRMPKLAQEKQFDDLNALTQTAKNILIKENSSQNNDVSKRNSDASKRKSDASKRNSDASKRKSDASKRKSDASFRNSLARIDLYVYIVKKLALDIKGIYKLELSKEELNKLGIYFNNYTANQFIEDPEIRFKPAFWFETEEYSLDYEINDKQELKMLIEKGYNTNIKPVLQKTNVNVFVNHTNMFNVTQDLMKYTGWDYNKTMKISPIAMNISFYFGYYKRYLVESVFERLPLLDKKMKLTEKTFADFLTARDNPKDEEHKPSIADYLVPILIKIGDIDYQPDKTNEFEYIMKDSAAGEYERMYDINYAECTLWYYPTEEFLEALPERVSGQLRKEMEVLEKVKSGEIPAEEACEAIKGKESMLGLCGMYAAALKDLKVYPNPNEGNAVNVSFLNLKQGEIRVYLHNAKGEYIADLYKGRQAEGMVELSLNLGALANGMYYVSVADEKGESSYIKLMVGK